MTWEPDIPPNEGFDPLRFDELQFRLQCESGTTCTFCGLEIENGMVHSGGLPFHSDCLVVVQSCEDAKPVRILNVTGLVGCIGFDKGKQPGSLLHDVIVGVELPTKKPHVKRLTRHQFEYI